MQRQPVATSKEPKIGVGPRSTLRVLVVEDHADTRRGLELFLKMFGWDITFACDFDSALAAGLQGDFDVLLSDLNLPDGNGWELIRRLAARKRRPGHAIAMSGYGTDQDVAQSEAAGFDVHLVKPVRPEELEKTLRAAEAKLGRLAETAVRKRPGPPPCAKPKARQSRAC